MLSLNQYLLESKVESYFLYLFFLSFKSKIYDKLRNVLKNFIIIINVIITRKIVSSLLITQSTMALNWKDPI